MAVNEGDQGVGVQDLPVALSLPTPLRDEVAAYVEVEAGWQVVGLEGPPRPALVVATEPIAGHDCVVVVEGVADPDRTRAALHAGALDVVAWPSERARLLDAPLRVRAAALPAGPPLLRVAGVRGGVGTSTVVLALGGLLAWAGRRVLVVGGDDLLELCGMDAWRGPGAAEIGALAPDEAGAEVEALSRPVRGVPGLAVLGGGAHVEATVGWSVELVLVDGRTDLAWAPELVCARPGTGLRAAAGVGAPVAVIGDGPLDPRKVRRALGPLFAGRLGWSVRVSRAGARGRVPADLPGTWLRDVQALCRRLVPAPDGGQRLSTGRKGESPTGAAHAPTVSSR